MRPLSVIYSEPVIKDFYFPFIKKFVPQYSVTYTDYTLNSADVHINN